MTDLYRIFTTGVQAWRRRVEALTYGYGGALGVAAEPYPHQISGIRRVLFDTRIRHLISDEVGLGKTVETIMIINALRWQNPSHRTVAIVPDRLVGQWQEEAWTRGHIRAAVPDEPSELEVDERGEDPTMWIVRPQSIQQNAFILDPSRHDLLVVDEPQTLPLDVLNAIEQKSDQFRQVLLLSATPRLGDPDWQRRFMTLLEPERSVLANASGKDIGSFLDDIEKAAIIDVGGDLKALTKPKAEAVFRSSSRDRRVLRETRQDWGHYLPERRSFEVPVEPLMDERIRFDLARKVIRNHGDASDLQSYPWTAIKGLHRSRRVARDALRGLAEREGDLKAEAETARQSALINPGDSRFEALLDLLSDIWRERFDEKIIIVAGDNPTIDMLRAALARYFPKTADEDDISVLRRTAAALESEASEIERMSADLAGFTQGSSRLLLIGDWVQAGLNLHYYSRNIIFYSPPWDPEAIDQLIGRIDRLRPNGLYKGDAGAHFGNVRIWHLYMKETPEALITQGLDAIGVFKRPLPAITSSEKSQISKLLLDLASARNVRSAIDAMSDIASGWNDSSTPSLLAMLSPFEPDRAQKHYETFREQPLVEPAMVATSRSASLTSRVEGGVRGWTNLINSARFFDIGSRADNGDPDSRFSTLWYTGRNPSDRAFDVDELEIGNWMTHHVPFIFRRRDIASPPKKIVHTDDGETDGRLLHFFDYGDNTHDSLVRGFIRLAEPLFRSDACKDHLVVSLPEEHPALALAGKTLLVSVGVADPGLTLLPEFDSSEMQQLIDAAPTAVQKARLKQDLQRAEDSWRADQRWIRSIFLSTLDARVSWLDGDKWVDLDDDLKWEIFRPLGPDGKLKPCPRSRVIDAIVPSAIVRSGRKSHYKDMTYGLRSLWQKSEQTFSDQLDIRRSCVEADSEDLIGARNSEYEQRLSEEGTFSHEYLWRGQVSAAERRVNMARLMLAQQVSCLDIMREKLNKVRLRTSWSIVVRPNEILNQPNLDNN